MTRLVLLIFAFRTAMNGYIGFRPDTPNEAIERVSASISAEDFYLRFIQTRKPCILTELPEDEDFTLVQAVNPDSGKTLADLLCRLEEFAETVVKVEQRRSKTLTFGTGELPKLKMTMYELVEALRGPKREQLYLTTQYKEEHEVQKPSNKKMEKYESFLPEPTIEDLLPSPIPALIPYIPLIPDIARNLVPQQVNMWMGASKSGTSSGLHHDYHDNIYILLQGRKRFTLFPPSDASLLYVHGDIYRVHSNGLITYSQIPTESLQRSRSRASSSKDNVHQYLDPARFIRNDGAHQMDVLRFRQTQARHHARKQLRLANSYHGKGKVSQEPVNAAKDALESVSSEMARVEACLEWIREMHGMHIEVEVSGAQASKRPKKRPIADIVSDDEPECEMDAEWIDLEESGSEPEFDSDEESAEEGDGSLMAPVGEKNSEEDSSDETSSEEYEDEEEYDLLKSQVLADADDDDDSVDWNGRDDFEDVAVSSDEEQSQASGTSKPTSDDHPPSFSRIPVPVLYHYLRTHFGLLNEYPQLEVSKAEIDAFPLLKFARPMSITLEAGEMLYLPASWFHEVTSFSNGDDPIHIALNYWFHPPLVDGTFEQPYEDDYWRHLFDKIMDEHLGDTVVAEAEEPAH